MELSDVIAAIMFTGIVAYALFGGADFGSGIWDLTAGNATEGGDKRRLIDQSLGPVWEANHVWLIFVIVFFFTGFPDAFVAFSSTLYVPISFAVLGIVFRGAGFAFRKFSTTITEARIHGALFAASSLITPFFLGAVAGAVASGRVPVDGSGNRWTSWLHASSLIGGILAVLVCAFLAATFLAAEAGGIGRDDLAEWFGHRAMLSAVVTGVFALGAIVPLAQDAETLTDGLTGRALPLISTSGLGGVATLWLLAKRRWFLARYTAGLAVASVVLGWGVAQYPWLLVDERRIDDAAGAAATLWGLLVVFGLAVALVLPSLGYLYVLSHRNLLSDETASAPGGH